MTQRTNSKVELNMFIPLLVLLMSTMICLVFTQNNLTREEETALQGFDRKEKWCHCWNNTHVHDIEIECRCHGMKFVSLPKKLPENLERLTISDAGMRVLEKNSFRMHRKKLQDM